MRLNIKHITPQLSAVLIRSQTMTNLLSTPKQLRTLLILIAIAAAVFIGIIFILLQTGVLSFTQKTGSIFIQDAYLTLDPELPKIADSEVPAFPSDTNRIYLIVILETEIPVNLSVRWYREDELFFQQSISADRPFAWHIQTENGVALLPGNYRAEIYLLKDPIRTLEFIIKDKN